MGGLLEEFQVTVEGTLCLVSLTVVTELYLSSFVFRYSMIDNYN
jgi:hypothetical protein